MTSAGIKGFEFQRDLFSHNLQYLKKSPRPALGGELSLACRRLINSGCRAGNTAILLQLIQQLAGLADGEVLWHITVKPLVHQLLRVDPLATRQAVDRLELVGRDRATTPRLRPTIRLSLRELFMGGCGGLNGTHILLLPQLGVYRLPASQGRPVDLVYETRPNYSRPGMDRFQTRRGTTRPESRNSNKYTKTDENIVRSFEPWQDAQDQAT